MEAQRELVLTYSPLVRQIVRRMVRTLPSHVRLDDLESFGFEALLHAARRYDAARGVKFETYAAIRIRGAVLDALRRARWAPPGTASLDDPTFVDEDGKRVPLVDALPDPEGPDPEGEALLREQRELLARAIESLSVKERWVITLYYYEGLTMREIGQVLGLTTARISQVHAMALGRLHKRWARFL